MTPLLAQRPRAERAFERIYRRHVGDVYRYCFAVLRNASDAEDVAQTTFMNAYRAFQRGERPRDPHNWLIAIAHNVCRQRFRQSQRRVEEVAYDDGVGGGLAPEDDAPTADEIRRALDHLAFNQRAALVMRELEGRSYAEIAEVLEVSVSAVETLLFRARRALREQLEGTLTCRAAELAMSKQLDGELSRDERAQLRAHLRECKACATVARKQRAQRTAIRALGTVPVPASLASLFGGGGAAVAAGGGAVASGVALKVAAVVAAGVVTAGAGYELVQEPEAPRAAATPAAVAPAPGVGAREALRPAARAVAHAWSSPDARPPGHRAVPVRAPLAPPPARARAAVGRPGHAGPATPPARKVRAREQTPRGQERRATKPASPAPRAKPAAAKPAPRATAPAEARPAPKPAAHRPPVAPKAKPAQPAKRPERTPPPRKAPVVPVEAPPLPVPVPEPPELPAP